MSSASPPGTTEQSVSANGDARLSGHWLMIARIIWVSLFVLNLVAFGVAVAAYFASIAHPCEASVQSACPVSQAQAETLWRMGIDPNTYAVFSAGIGVLVVLAGSALAMILFWRQSNDWMALMVGIFLVAYPITNFALVAGPIVSPGVQALLNGPDLIIYYGVFLIFPNGRFIPRWTWLLLAAWVAFIWTFNTTDIPWLAIGYPILYLSVLAVQAYRYRRVYDARQRQQTKWVILGFVVTLLANIAVWIVLPNAVAAFQQPESVYPLVGYPIYELITLALPVSFAIAISRYRLFDIDVIINRALVYGSLTALLAAVYFAVVIGLQALTTALTGQRKPQAVIIVLSTLLIATLFNPLRRRLQTTIDQRFYRRKYDAAKTLETFAKTLRSQVDLAELNDHLLGVVTETMQPAHVSLWLRSPDTEVRA